MNAPIEGAGIVGAMFIELGIVGLLVLFAVL